jgi:hypothetical protein
MSVELGIGVVLVSKNVVRRSKQSFAVSIVNRLLFTCSCYKQTNTLIIEHIGN